MRIKANRINITFNGPEFSSESVIFFSSFFLLYPREEIYRCNQREGTFYENREAKCKGVEIGSGVEEL